MTSPAKAGRTPWPTEVVVGGVSATLGKRAINMDPEDVDDSDDASLLAANTIVGSMAEGSAVTWSQGPVASKAPRATVSAEDAEVAVRAGASLFLVRGSNYRIYAIADAALATAGDVSPPEEPAAGAAAGQGDGGVSPTKAEDGGDGHKSRNAKQYTKAVAFEFVSGVLGNVIGDEAAEAAWGEPGSPSP